MEAALSTVTCAVRPLILVGVLGANYALAEGTRDPSQIPFDSTSVFNLPLGSGAKWQYNAQLAGAGIFVNRVGNYNQNIYSSRASDPLVTVTVNGTWGSPARTYRLHIPRGAVPSGPFPGDNPIAIDDTSTHTWYSFGQFAWKSSKTATAAAGSAEPDYGSGIEFGNSNWTGGVGTLRQSDLEAGAINHMLRIVLDFGMLKSWSPTSTKVLAPYAWPQTEEDGFALSGNGNPRYTGTVPYGVTIGIPANAVEPDAIKADRGADMLWRALREHGAMVRDSGLCPNLVVLQTDQDVSPADPLLKGMEQHGHEIMSQARILINQGPASVNGGGTPIVPLIPPLADAPRGHPGGDASPPRPR